MKLLIVDDEIYAIQGIIDGVDWKNLELDRVLTANSYAQAVNIFMENKIDILLCDIEMPYGSGVELVEWVKGHSPETECIFLTCHDEFQFARKAINLNCLDYLLKPASVSQITEILEKAIRTVKEKQTNLKYQDYGKSFIKKMGESTNDSVEATEKIKDYIKVHIADTLTVEGLAKYVNLSPDYLTRTFKKKYNLTIIDYITEQRMFLAKELLIQNTMSISMVAVKVGYGNYSYFTKMFKKFYGLSPRELQQEYLRTK